MLKARSVMQGAQTGGVLPHRPDARTRAWEFLARGLFLASKHIIFFLINKLIYSCVGSSFLCKGFL